MGYVIVKNESAKALLKFLSELEVPDDTKAKEESLRMLEEYNRILYEESK